MTVEFTVRIELDRRTDILCFLNILFPICFDFLLCKTSKTNTSRYVRDQLRFETEINDKMFVFHRRSEKRRHFKMNLIFYPNNPLDVGAVTILSNSFSICCLIVYINK